MWSPEIAATTSYLVTFTLSAAIGYARSKRLSGPQDIAQWVAWLLGLAVISAIGRSTWIIYIFGVGIPLDAIFAGAGVGLLIGFLMDELRGTRRLSHP